MKVFEFRQPYIGSRGKEHARQDSQWLPEHRDKTPRTNYIWGIMDEVTYIRSATMISKLFVPTIVPTSGEIVFAFDASPKIGKGGWKGHKKPTRRPLPSNQYNEWLENKLLNDCGIDIIGIEITPITVNVPEHRYNYPGMSVVGEGRIINEERYRETILHGISGAGPKCWGFGMLIVNQ